MPTFVLKMGFLRRSIKAIRHTVAAILLHLGVVAGTMSAHAVPDGALVIKSGTGKCIAPGNFAGCTVGKNLSTPKSVVVSPDAKFVYVAYSNALAIFQRDLFTGLISPSPLTDGCFSSDGSGPCSQNDKLANTRALAMDSDGKNVYVITESGVLRFDRNASTGVLTFVPSNCFGFGGMYGCLAVQPSLISPARAVVSPDGRSLFVVDSLSDTLYRFARDLDTGALSPGACYNENGYPTCFTLRISGSFRSVAFSPDSTSLYLLTDRSLLIFASDPTTGNLMQKAGSQGCFNSKDGTAVGCASARAISESNDLVVSPDGKSLYVTSAKPSLSAVAVFDRATNGSLTQKGGTAGCLSQNGYDDYGIPSCLAGRGLSYVMQLLMSVDGKNLYTAGNSLGVLLSLGRNTASGSAQGTLSQSEEQAACYSRDGSFTCNTESLIGGLNDASLAMSPDGANVYVTSPDTSFSGGGGGPEGVILVFDRPQEATPTPTFTPTPTETPTPTATPTPTPSAGDGISVAAPRFIVKPAAITKSRSAMFAFHSSTAGASYWCSLDGSQFRACRWPVRYVALRMGQHTFQVKAVRRGSSSSITSYSWTIKN